MVEREGIGPSIPDLNPGTSTMDRPPRALGIGPGRAPADEGVGPRRGVLSGNGNARSPRTARLIGKMGWRQGT